MQRDTDIAMGRGHGLSDFSERLGRPTDSETPSRTRKPPSYHGVERGVCRLSLPTQLTATFHRIMAVSCGALLDGDGRDDL